MIETLFQESHHARYILKCRCCGTRYLKEFHEEIDWKDGDDPTWNTYFPIQSENQLEEMRRAHTPMELLKFYPRLTEDWPPGATQRRIVWVGKDEA